MPQFKQVILIILDGWGYREDTKHNPIAAAKKPFFDYLWKTYPHALLEASGEAVGLPPGTLGGSEVGHTTIGAGRAMDTDLARINKSFAAGEAKTNPAFAGLFEHVKKHNSILHILGMVSDKGVHAHQEHLFEFLKAAHDAGIKKIAIHAFTDGRDTPPQSSDNYIRELEDILEKIGVGRIATVSGRYYAMDRDKNWDRIEKVEHVMFHGKGQAHTGRPSKVIKMLYEQGLTDEHFEPMVFVDDSGKSLTVQANDGLFFFNYRPDRARQISQKILERAHAQNLCFVTMTEYDESFQCLVAFESKPVETTLASEISKAGFTQAHIAETDKYAHLTYFLNGGREEPHDKEEFVLVDTRKDVKTHDLAPEMRASVIADEAIARIKNQVNFIAINFANPDIVGHSGNFKAMVKAIETVDAEVKRVVEAALANHAVVLITADHGNAEISHDEEVGQNHTAHTLSPVPVILTIKNLKLKNGTLADIAPMILKLFNLPIPSSMTGSPLFPSP
ncbi:MAG: phosphoglycerate mutase (2,3-diphosphoglycerate-independent) [Candidatus Doudnabacteria bacterium RIFCSPHIGHO2_01_FULL_46_14]|uniref:2,3-bisphosphoglycerate-independent phosphoglycerate mutase n=1 Tax=Candidatus Doudnabacteria bacterium RIFCSPHIGHO2_01_FULL_46_14 TaxID=1817824 RepID=A0A1F5NMY6_9BACT|nr:MAG: phosphoglycerate mutase (2,3-diphosphoglycerate-independent) [Candidatus Doudnabacteria bacterium RIFCSPHIGHO2_01_FULL_46_14]